MKTINISPYIKELLIFDDPEYCHNYDMTEFCPWLDEDDNCGLFQMKSMDTSEDLHIIKCPDCRTAFNKAKGIK